MLPALKRNRPVSGVKVDFSLPAWEPEWPRGGGGTGSQPDFHWTIRAGIPAVTNLFLQKLPPEISHPIFFDSKTEHPTLKPLHHLTLGVGFHRFLAAATARQVVENLGIHFEIGPVKIPEQMPQKLIARRQTGQQRSLLKGIFGNAHLLAAIGL